MLVVFVGWEVQVVVVVVASWERGLESSKDVVLFCYNK